MSRPLDNVSGPRASVPETVEDALASAASEAAGRELTSLGDHLLFWSKFAARLSITMAFGMATYMGSVEQPQRLKIPGGVALHWWRCTFIGGARLIASLQLTTMVLCALNWLLTDDIIWAICGLVIFLLTPYTYMFVLPVVKRLLKPDLPEKEQIITILLKRWAYHHWIRWVCLLVVTVVVNFM